MKDKKDPYVETMKALLARGYLYSQAKTLANPTKKG